jgi:hypothetical protein
MAVGNDVVVRRYAPVTADVGIPVDVQVQSADEVVAYYGSASIKAIAGTDYTVVVANDFQTFTLTPTAGLLGKINALIAADSTEVNALTVRRDTDALSTATQASANSTQFLSDQIDRAAMRDAEQNDALDRALKLPEVMQPPYPDLALKSVPADVSKVPALVFLADGGVGGGPNTDAIEGAQGFGERAEAAAAVAEAAAVGISNAALQYVTVAAFVAASEASRGVGSLWDASEFKFEEVGASETNFDLENSAGVKFRARQTLGMLTARQFNAVEEADVRQAIQDAVDRASMGKGDASLATGGRVLADLRRGTMSAPLHVGYGDGFGTAHLEGMGIRYFNGASFPGTALVMTHQRSPAIEINGSRNSSVARMTLVGEALSAINAFVGQPNTRTKMDITQWYAAFTGAGFHGQEQNSPPCAIGIGTRTGAAPASPYPDVAYPAYVSQVQYGKGLPSGDAVSEMDVHGFVNGLVLGPQIDGNHDFLKVHRLRVFSCAIGVSLGPTQARISEFLNLDGAHVHTLCTNKLHGVQSGRFDSMLRHAHAGGFIGQVFDLGNGSTGGSFTLESSYFEALGRLGRLITTVGAITPAVILRNGTYQLISNADDEFICGNAIEGSWRDTVVLDNCRFTTPGVVFLGGGPTEVRSAYCTSRIPQKPYEAAAFNCSNGGLLTDPAANSEFTVGMRAFSIATPTSVSDFGVTDKSYKATGRDTCIPHNMASGNCFTRGRFLDKVISSITNTAATISNVTRTDRTIQLTSSLLASSNIDFHYTQALLPGCVWIHKPSGTVLFVRSADPATGVMELEMQNNYYFDGTNYQILNLPDATPYDPLNSDYQCLNGLVYAPARALVGDISIGSNIITEVRDVQSSSPLTNFGLTVGDRFAQSCYNKPPHVGSNQLAITGIDTGARTITLQGNFNYSMQGAPINFWWRQPPANATAR